MCSNPGEPREVHHFALLIGYGCSAINPYLAYETIDSLIQDGLLLKTDHKTAVKKFIKAAIKGVVKTMAKMGISTVQSYRGAQIFEAIGLNSEVVDKYFTWDAVAHSGRGLEVIAEEALTRHRRAFPRESVGELDAGGQYQWRDGGEQHCSIRRRSINCKSPAAPITKRFIAIRRLAQRP